MYTNSQQFESRR